MDKTQTRKPHKKSRNGCFPCKARHVKCDEQKPECVNCDKYGMECKYPQPGSRISSPARLISTTATTPSSTEGAVFNQPILPAPVSNRVHESAPDIPQLRLLHHFTTVTAKTLSAESRNEDVYSSHLVKVAFDYPFLLYAVFALAALHLSRIEPTLRAEYLLQAELHHGVALTRFRTEISDINESNYKAVLFFASVLFPYSCAMPVDVGLDPGQTFDSILSNLVLTRRVRPMVRQFYDALTESELGRLRPLDTQGIDWNTVKLPAVSGVGRLRNLVEVTRDFHAQDITKAYDGAIHILETVFDVAGQSPVPPSDALLKMWIHFVTPRFMELLLDRQPGALIIFAHYAVLLGRSSHYWFLDGVAEQILSITEALVPPAWSAWLDWPKEQVQRSTRNTSNGAA